MKNWRIDDLDEPAFRTIREGSKIVADVWGIGNPIHPELEEMDENARLIAAAPEMYRLIMRMVDEQDAGGFVLPETMNKARSIIK